MSTDSSSYSTPPATEDTGEIHRDQGDARDGDCRLQASLSDLGGLSVRSEMQFHAKGAKDRNEGNSRDR